MVEVHKKVIAWHYLLTQITNKMLWGPNLKEKV